MALLSFDGSGSISVWEETLALGSRTGAKFTYFISAPFFITRGEVTNYKVPHYPMNRSLIPWETDRTTAIARIALVSRCLKTGHEIGGHAVGHFGGQLWEYEDWDRELKFFSNVIDTRLHAYNLSKSNFYFSMRWIRGFRAPLLEGGDTMREALSANGYRYDASVYRRDFRLIEEAIPVIPLPVLKSLRGNEICGMDWNFYSLHSGAREETNTAKLAAYEDDLFQAYTNYFVRKCLGPNAKPMVTGQHFERWNQGAYWKAFVRFVYFLKTYDTEFLTYSQWLSRERNERGKKVSLSTPKAE